jgi:hypothetical protein
MKLVGSYQNSSLDLSSHDLEKSTQKIIIRPNKRVPSKIPSNDSKVNQEIKSLIK